MSNLNAKEYKSFEDIKKTNEEGSEIWLARDLANVLEYAKWRNFLKVIALGQTYFAIQTRRQEVAGYFNQLDEDNKRLIVRGEVKQWNKMLAEVVHKAGLITDKAYAIFQNAGYNGLYGGLDVADIHARKGLAENDKILDFMGSEELAANLFRMTQIESKMRRENIQGAETANITHYTVGKEVREAIRRVGAQCRKICLPKGSPSSSF